MEDSDFMDADRFQNAPSCCKVMVTRTVAGSFIATGVRNLHCFISLYPSGETLARSTSASSLKICRMHTPGSTGVSGKCPLKSGCVSEIRRVKVQESPDFSIFTI